MAIATVTELKVWQRAMELVVEIYALTDAYPPGERFGLTAQTRKSAVSIPSNIAEGFCRRSLATYLNHLDIALGSEGELFTQLEIGRRLGFAPIAAVDRCLKLLSEVGRMLRGLSASLERHSPRLRTSSEPRGRSLEDRSSRIGNP